LREARAPRRSAPAAARQVMGAPTLLGGAERAGAWVDIESRRMAAAWRQQHPEPQYVHGVEILGCRPFRG
jgi:hypothetical protein